MIYYIHQNCGLIISNDDFLLEIVESNSKKRKFFNIISWFWWKWIFHRQPMCPPINPFPLEWHSAGVLPVRVFRKNIQLLTDFRLILHIVCRYIHSPYYYYHKLLRTDLYIRLEELVNFMKFEFCVNVSERLFLEIYLHFTSICFVIYGVSVITYINGKGFGKKCFLTRARTWPSVISIIIILASSAEYEVDNTWPEKRLMWS